MSFDPVRGFSNQALPLANSRSPVGQPASSGAGNTATAAVSPGLAELGDDGRPEVADHPGMGYWLAAWTCVFIVPPSIGRQRRGRYQVFY